MPFSILTGINERLARDEAIIYEHLLTATYQEKRTAFSIGATQVPGGVFNTKRDVKTDALFVWTMQQKLSLISLEQACTRWVQSLPVDEIIEYAL